MNRRVHRRFFAFSLLGVGLLFMSPAGARDRRARAGANPPVGTVHPVSTFEITIPAPVFEKTPEGFDAARFDGYGESAPAGHPSRPVRIFRLEIPAGTVPRVEIVDAAYRHFDRLDLAPAPSRGAGRLQPSGRRDTGPPVHRREPGAFGRPGWSPQLPVQVGEVGFIRHRRYAQLKVHPLQYDPVRRRARVYSRLTIRVHLEPSGEAAGSARQPEPRREGFRPVYRSGFRDGARLSAGFEAARIDPTSPSGSTPAGATVVGPSAAGTTVTAGSSGTPAYRIRVSRAGIYRLTYEYMDDPSRAADLIALAPDPDDFKLTSQGVEIPLRVVNGGNPDSFEPGEFIEFYGEPLVGDFLDPDVFEQGDFTDTNVYRLSIEAGPRQRIPETDGSPVSGFPVAASFLTTEIAEEAGIFLGQLPFNGAGHWYFDPMIREGPGGSQGETDFFVTLNGTGIPGTAHLEARMLGLDYVDNLHRTALRVNGVSVGATEDWDGFVFHTQTADFDAGLLVDGINTITVVTPMGRVGGGGPVEIEGILLDRIELRFDRQFDAVGEQLRFEAGNQDVRFQVAGMGSAPAVYEVTATVPGSSLRSPVRYTGGTVAGGILTFEVGEDGGLPPGATRAFAAASGAGLLLPDAVELDAPSDLRSTANGADYLIIAHRDLYDLTPGTNLDQVLGLRQAQGLRTMVVDIQDVYDEFSFGIFDPQAVRDFLEYAFFNWTAPAPTFVVLLGDANFDTKNHFGAPETRVFVPTYIRDDAGSPLLGYYADDTYFAAIAGTDPVPDLFLGRVPAHDLAEAEGYWQKVLEYEIPTTGAAWESHAVFVADEGEPLFESVQDDQIERYFLTTPHTFEKIYYQDIVDANGGFVTQETADLATGQIQAEIDLGGAVLNFVGHGGFQTWSRFPNIYQSLSNKIPPGDPPVLDDIDVLANGPRYPFMINTNCITGGFHITGAPGQPQEDDLTYSFAEDFLLTPSKGAIGALAPSHLTFSFILNLVNNTLFGAMYGPEKERNLGTLQLLLRLGFESLGMVRELRSYVFLGDPALTLRVPAPAPPSGVTAVAGNAVVDLSWSASPEAAAYHVYRSVGNPSGTYVLLTPVPVPATAFIDPDVVNSITYYYTVTSIDVNGFEGRYSNFNTDCQTAGPDCVRAVPLNPDPPAVPTGLVATDLGIGSTLLLTWNPNSEPDLKSYSLEYGTATGVYDQQISLPAGQTTLTLPGLTQGTEYFFVIMATNTSDMTSGPSAEASATPRLVLGITPPRAVQGLQVFTDGADLLLSWDPVVENIIGDPITVSTYTVFASTSGPGFPLEGNELATVPGTTTEYRHLGAAIDPFNHFYLVAARDGDGLLSGGGLEIPAAVMDLRVEVVDGTSLRFDWSPIAHDLNGTPLSVSHYALYSGTAPFSRAQVGPALLQLDGIAAPPLTIPLPGEDRYYSLLAVDHHGSMSPF